MKVYRTIRDIIFTGPVYHTLKKGTRLFEREGETRSYQPEDGSYPIRDVEDNPSKYERMEDDNDHDIAYYVDKVYTQYQVDQLLKKQQQ